MRDALIYHQGQSYNLAVHESGEFISDIIVSNRSFFEIDTLEFCHQNFDLSYVLDVGANIGNHTFFFENVCNSKVVAIEPHPENFELLELNTKRSFNLNIALSNIPGNARLVDVKTCRGNCSLVGNDYQLSIGDSSCLGVISGFISVQTITLDMLGLRGLTFIKLDAEGAEVDILRGSIQTLERFSGVIMVEIHEETAFQRLTQGKYSRKILFLFLIDLGFRCIHKDRYGNYFFQK
jgi:FkbM family methyltransferase